MDFYAQYAAWHERFYGVPYLVTREEWTAWSRQPRTREPSDIDSDYAREREGDAQ